MDTALIPGLTSWPTFQGRHYRLAGLIRGPAGSTDIERAINEIGLDSAVVYGSRVGLPGDWPAEDLPPPSADERPFRVEATWGRPVPAVLPSAIRLPDGTTVTFFNAWEHINDFHTVATIERSASTGNSLNIVGAILGFGLAGFLAYKAVKRTRSLSEVMENPMSHRG